MMQDMIDLTRALDFAARKHQNQRRMGADGQPYLNHLAEVAHMLAEATEGGDPALVIAGLLHDSIEDTDATSEQLERLFGPDVAALVMEVSDDKSLPKAERKRLQIETAPKKSIRAKMIKLADKTSNLRSLADDPPVRWGAKQRREYLDWAVQVVDGCRGVNARLEAAFDDALSRGRAVLEGAGAS